MTQDSNDLGPVEEFLETEGSSAEAGFSLLEILVALAIIASLAALVGPRLLGQVDKSKVKTAQVQIQMLETSLKNYVLVDGGTLPETGDVLQVLVSNVNNDPNWAGPYLSEDSVPLDPWGSPYVFTPGVGRNGIGEIISLGADKQAGGNGINADIG